MELLVANRTIKGKFSLQWNATNTLTGTYFIRVASDQHIQIQNIVSKMKRFILLIITTLVACEDSKKKVKHLLVTNGT